jgi:hypothetical protein
VKEEEGGAGLSDKRAGVGMSPRTQRSPDVIQQRDGVVCTQIQKGKGRTSPI